MLPLPSLSTIEQWLIRIFNKMRRTSQKGKRNRFDPSSSFIYPALTGNKTPTDGSFLYVGVYPPIPRYLTR